MDLPSASASAQLTTKPGKCHLLSLPRELREEIFSHTVFHPGTIWYDPGPIGIHPAPPTILRTCLQIRDEALPIYFQINRFRFEAYGHFRTIPASVGKMRYIEVYFRELHNAHILNLDMVEGFKGCEIGLQSINKSQRKFELQVLQSVRLWIDREVDSGQTAVTKDMFEELLRHFCKTIQQQRAIG